MSNLDTWWHAHVPAMPTPVARAKAYRVARPHPTRTCSGYSEHPHLRADSMPDSHRPGAGPAEDGVVDIRSTRASSCSGVLATALALFLLVLPTVCSADDLTNVTVAFTPSGAQIEGDASLSIIRSAIEHQVPGLLRERLPELFTERTVGNLKYRDFHAEVDSVSFRSTGSDRELGVTIRVTLRAERAQLVVNWHGIHSTTSWRDDGSVDAIQFEAVGRVAFAITLPRTIVARGLLDSVSGTVQLELLRGLTASATFNGRELQSRTVQVPVPEGVSPSVQIDDARIVRVSGDDAHVQVQVSVPPSAAPVGGPPLAHGPP